jgi:hypothetical protein
MPSSIESVKLQLAMAFGQGAGAMLANTEALETLLAEEGEVLTRAMTDWNASHWAFTELVRVLGQLSAAHAAAAGSAEIRWPDIAASLQAVMTLCPCLEPGARLRNPNAGR